MIASARPGHGPATSPAVPLDLSAALSPGWVEAVLRRRWPGVRVTDVTVVETLRTLATKVRFAVTLEGDAPADAPRALCLKAFFDLDEYQVRSAYVSLVESLFYERVAPGLAMEVPACLYAGRDAAAGRGAILMRDISAAGGAFLTALSPYGVERAGASLDQLARLHAGGDAAAFRDEPLVAARVADFARNPVLPVALLQELLEAERGEGLPSAIRDAARLHRGLAALAQVIASGPETLVHGDAHAGNIYEIDGRIGLIDWQVLQRGGWAQDVAYHIAAVLTPEEAIASEWDLLDHYLDRLGHHGGRPPQVEEARRLYRVSLVYGYYLWGITRRVEPGIVNVFVNRLGSAVARHDSLALLGV